MNITNQRSWLDNPRLRYRRQLRSLLFGESLTINGYQVERSLEGGYSYFIGISTEEQSLEQVLDLLTKEDTMTQFKLPIGALTRPLADTVVRESGVWYGFNIGTEQRKSIKYWLRETIEQLNNTQPVTAEVLHYDVAPNVYPARVFAGIANGLLERGKQIVDIRVAVAESEIVVMGVAA